MNRTGRGGVHELSVAASTSSSTTLETTKSSSTARLQSPSDGSLIFFLHINRPWLPYVIFHAGIVLQEEKETRLRHASKGRGKTTDVSLVRYLQFLEKRYQRWKVLGIHLEQLTDRCGTQPQP